MNSISNRQELEQTPVFTNFDEAIKVLDQVQRLNFSGQKVEKLDSDISIFSNLVELNLSDNQFKQIPAGIEKLKLLKFLDISKTSIRRLKPAFNLNLTELKCENTPITYEEIEQFKQLHPQCAVIANAKKIEQHQWYEKLAYLLLVLLLMACTYGIILIIIPPSDTVRIFLLGFGSFIIGVAALAVFLRAIIVSVKKMIL